MAAGWQDELAVQAEAVAARMREGLAGGLGLLRNELGLELGLEPERLPAWLLLLMPVLCLLGLAVFWAAACSGRKRSRAPPGEEEEEETVTPGKALKSPKAEELRKKPKKKITEKIKPNGRPLHDLSEEEILPVTRKEMLKQPLDAEKKNEKSKKNKKKTKPETKHTHISSLDGKEVDEGAWETKISNREKRQQRKRDKVTGDMDIETTTIITTEQISAVSSLPLGPRKTKGLSEIPTVNGGSWTEKSVKLPAQLGGGEEKWTSLPSGPKRKSENSAWNQDTGDAGGNGKDWGVPLTSTWSERPLFSSIPPWSTVDGRMNAPEQTSGSFASLGLNPSVSGTVSETVSQTSTSDIHWDISCNQPHIDDEWSGPNGLDSADPGSDWNAPMEAWGNWVEEETTACPQPEEPISDVQKVSEDEKERESTLQSSTSSKSKKKKKKKKKQGEETSSPVQDPEDVDREVGNDFQEDNLHVQPQQEIIFPMKTISTSEPAEPEEEEPTLAVFTEPSVKVLLSIPEQISSQVPQMLQETDVSHSNKQNSVPPSSQIKSEESWESPKQVKKKKKARRET
uniref:Protein LYRIC isoform X2 n=1 Tax=Geotrypetes seraphini TaxID=260995 RepID=A0A6P8QR62_GEOSA|nr:protein LYRIC isoform X2 [Geotrypetes seraphini]